MKLVLGLDIGITSVGWSIINQDDGSIVDCGVRLFEEGTAEENLKRRTKRSSRRLKRRLRNRLDDAKKLLIKNNLIDDNFEQLDNPYMIREKGLTQKLSNEELATAILHLVKRRGSGLETVEDDESKQKEAEKAKSVLSANERLIRQGLFPCQIQLKNATEHTKIRGEHNNFKTSHYLLELNKILENQEVDEAFKVEIRKILTRRRQYYEGPGSLKSPTPYGRFILNEDGKIEVIDLIEKMRGKCSVYPNELRAPKFAPSVELFNFLNDLNNLTISHIDGEEKITEEQKRNIVNDIIINGKHSLTPNQLAKFLGIDLESIKGFRANKKEEPILTKFEGYNKLIKAIGEDFSRLSWTRDFSTLDSIVDVLTKTKGIDERIEGISSILNDQSIDVIRALANIGGMTQYHALSFKAIKEMLNELFMTNDNQMQVLARKGLAKNRADHLKGLKRIPFDDELILSPVAKKAQRETIKVVNAVRSKYGELDTIVVEMARDKNSSEQKTRINTEQKRFEIENKKVKDFLQGRKVNGKSMLKYRLYLQQDGKSFYSGKPIDLDLLLSDPTAYEIDHIVPISISFDDSLSNKVLVTRKENQIKGNRTPYAVFQNEGFGGWNFGTYYSFALSILKRNPREFSKKFYYLVFDKDISKFDVMKEFINRNLVDTRYSSRAVLNLLQDYFKVNQISTKVASVRGSVTSAFRKRLDISKDREQDYYHHAVDATIVAMLSKKSNIYKVFSNTRLENELYAFNNFELTLESEYEFFDVNLMRLMSKVQNIGKKEDNGDLHASYRLEPKLSHKVDRKPNRQISDETIYGTRQLDGTEVVIKKYKNIYDPKFMQLAEIIDGKSKSVTKDKLLIYRHDIKSYEKLVQIVEEYKKVVGPIEKENPFYWWKEVQQQGYITKFAKKDNGAPIIAIKYIDSVLGNHIDVTSNYKQNQNTDKQKKVVLLQISPFRTDFYISPSGQYKFVTLRYNDVSYRSSSKSYVVDQTAYEKKLVVKGISIDDKFQFTLYRNDVFRIYTEDKSGVIQRDTWRLIATANDLVNRLEVKPLERHKYFNLEKQKEEVQKFITIGKSVKKIIKYNLDVLGNRYQVQNEDLTLEIDERRI